MQRRASALSPTRTRQAGNKSVAPYFRPETIQSAITHLQGSSPRGRLLPYLVGQRTIALAGTHSIGVAEGVPQYLQAVQELSYWPSNAGSKVDTPYFNPFQPNGSSYMSRKFPSNGPGNTLHNWETKAGSPFTVDGTVSPKAIARRDAGDVRADEVRKFLVAGSGGEQRPRLIDVATWFYRRLDLEELAAGPLTREAVEGRFLQDFDLDQSVARNLFTFADEDPDHVAGSQLELALERALPEDYLPEAPAGVASDAHRSGAVDIAGHIDAYIRSRGYTFEPWQIAAFVTAARTKPFVILAGISGTGKTRLPRLVAEATGAVAHVIPVRPDWTDSSELLGYEQLSGAFVPGHLLRVADQAMAEPDRQFFFILDEMNVARVEYYFAEVLSLMENRHVSGGSIRTDALVPNAPSADGDGTNWGGVYLPSNVTIVGTVNMDETTHGFSRKVLDRAFVLELTEVDLEDLGDVSTGPVEAVVRGHADWRPDALRLVDHPAKADPIVAEVVDALVAANATLEGSQLHVGYRVRDEVALFCLRARDCAETFVDLDGAVVSPLDLCLSMKILPRIQGGGAPIRNVLEGLSKWLEAGESDAAFPRSERRVRLMRERLDGTGFTTFWV